jgi:hypothetical protein
VQFSPKLTRALSDSPDPRARLRLQIALRRDLTGQECDALKADIARVAQAQDIEFLPLADILLVTASLDRVRALGDLPGVEFVDMEAEASLAELQDRDSSEKIV